MKFYLYLVTWISGIVPLNCTCLHPSVNGEQYLLKNPKLSLKNKGNLSIAASLFFPCFRHSGHSMSSYSSQKLPPPTLSSGCLPPKPRFTVEPNFPDIPSWLPLETSIIVLSIWIAILLITMGNPSGNCKPEQPKEQKKQTKNKTKTNNVGNVQTEKFFPVSFNGI